MAGVLPASSEHLTMLDFIKQIRFCSPTIDGPRMLEMDIALADGSIKVLHLTADQFRSYEQFFKQLESQIGIPFKPKRTPPLEEMTQLNNEWVKMADRYLADADQTN